MTAVNYNDGEWHYWGGGQDCPVHASSLVEAVWHDKEQRGAGITGPRPAGPQLTAPCLPWEKVVRFRVVKAHLQAAEVVLTNDGGILREAGDGESGRLFREVLE